MPSMIESAAWRALAERVSHSLVFPRRLPPEFGRVRMLVSTEGGLRYLLRPMRQVDPLLLGLASLCVRPGDHVWDVGANLGLFTFAAAARAGADGSVLALEPDAHLVNLLRRSALGLPPVAAPVDVLTAAAFAEAGVARLHIARRSRSTNHLEGYGTTQTGGTRSTELVPTIPLDLLLHHAPRPTVVKVDVEGAEVGVLAGAARLLAEVTPLLICEVAGENAELVSKTLHESGYLLFDAEADRSLRTPVDQAAYMTVAVGKAQRSRLFG
jgi:FkbM family methyltransferase